MYRQRRPAIKLRPLVKGRDQMHVVAEPGEGQPVEEPRRLAVRFHHAVEPIGEIGGARGGEVVFLAEVLLDAGESAKVGARTARLGSSRECGPGLRRPGARGCAGRSRSGRASFIAPSLSRLNRLCERCSHLSRGRACT